MKQLIESFARVRIAKAREEIQAADDAMADRPEESLAFVESELVYSWGQFKVSFWESVLGNDSDD